LSARKSNASDPIYPLLDEAVHVWLCRTDMAWDDVDRQARYRALLSEEERQRIDRIHQIPQRHTALLTRVLVRTVLSEYAPIEASDWRFTVDVRNKPRIASPASPLRFNLSHSREWIACAVGTGYELGVDVESCDRERDLLRLARRFFSPEEFEALCLLSEEQRIDRFYEYWTLKESWLKATGHGISGGLDSAFFDLQDSGGMTFNSPVEGAAYRFHCWQLDSSYRLALCQESLNQQAAAVTIYECEPLVKSWERELPERFVF
jgi:4'-phosphopantetheinyl transferase